MTVPAVAVNLNAALHPTFEIPDLALRCNLNVSKLFHRIDRRDAYQVLNQSSREFTNSIHE
jgi:hypothetical protein